MKKTIPKRMLLSKKMPQTDEGWRKKLSPEKYRILREKGTEMPFTGKYYYHKGKGVYQCAGCGQELFHSDAKYASGSGWPSFWTPLAKGKVTLRMDTSHDMQRIEAACAHCGGHLGHVFDDGPKPTGKRYCINSSALAFCGETRRGTRKKKGKSKTD